MSGQASAQMEPRTEAARHLILVRPGAELATKSHRTRQSFRRVLRANVADALDRLGVPYRLRSQWSRLLVETEAPEEALGVLERVFGVGSLSPVEVTGAAEVEEIARVGGAHFAAAVRGRTYAVRCKRIGTHPFTSLDVERALGAVLNAEGRVDLERPEVTVYVEVNAGRAYLFTERRRAIGGLPAGVQGRAVTLVSGGFDSAVAAWRVMRRGVGMDYVFCNLGGAAYERMVLQVVKVLSEAWAFGQRPRLHVIDFTEPVDQLKAECRPGYWQIVLKRLMYRAGEQVARELRADALVTGEAIGQVSSQTVANLNAIDPAADLPVLRPLIGWDKQEIVDEAKRIGTAPLSERVKEYCAIATDRPVTAGRRGKVAAEEAKLDLGVLERAVAARKVIDVTAVGPRDLRMPYLFTREIPADAIVIDCQPRHMYRAWHVPDAEHYEPNELLERLKRLDKNRTYVLYCTHGTQTPYLAEVMQQRGFEGYAFEGGLSEVKRYVEAGAAG